jgi:hypothetical protein
MYGQMAKDTYSPDSQKELKKLFDAEAGKTSSSNNQAAPKAMNLGDTYKTQLYKFDHGIKNYANSYWNKIVRSDQDNWEDKLTKKLFDKNLFANDQTISVGDKILVPMTSSSNELFIVYGKENPDLKNFTMEGAVEFGQIGSKSQEILTQDIADWLKNYIEFYENQI